MMRDNQIEHVALVNALVASISHEEVILERLVSASLSGKTEEVMAAANEFAAHRSGAKSENCAA